MFDFTHGAYWAVNKLRKRPNTQTPMHTLTDFHTFFTHFFTLLIGRRDHLRYIYEVESTNSKHYINCESLRENQAHQHNKFKKGKVYDEHPHAERYLNS